MNRHLILAVLTVGIILAAIQLVDSTSEPTLVTGGPMPPYEPVILPDEAPGAGIPDAAPGRSTTDPATPDDPPETIFTDMRMELDQVAEAYAQASRFPPFSQPLYSAEDVARFMPETPAQVSLPFPRDDGRPPVQVGVTLDRYQYFPGDLLRWRVDISDPAGSGPWQVRVRAESPEGDVLVSPTALPESDSGHLNGTLVMPDPLDSRAAYHLIVQVDGPDGRYQVAAPFRLSQAVARITGLAWAAPDGPWLHLALNTQVYRPGYYFVSANLYSARTGEPLVHLEGEQRLEAGVHELMLRAHASALRERGDPGPYVLKNIRLIRGAEDGETDDLAGQPPESPVGIPAFDLNSYADTPWEDPEAAERVAFLKKLAGSTQEQ